MPDDSLDRDRPTPQEEQEERDFTNRLSDAATESLSALSVEDLQRWEARRHMMANLDGILDGLIARCPSGCDALARYQIGQLLYNCATRLLGPINVGVSDKAAVREAKERWSRAIPEAAAAVPEKPRSGKRTDERRAWDAARMRRKRLDPAFRARERELQAARRQRAKLNLEAGSTLLLASVQDAVRDGSI
jgi:hypothetical protein